MWWSHALWQWLHRCPCNEELDANDIPVEYVALRDKMKEVDSVLFVTPEYNRSVPAVLKNALDVGSRPYGHSVWDGKVAAIMSQSPGSISAFGANHHLRQSLVFLNIHTLQQPEAYIGNSYELFDDSGKIKNEGTIQFLQSVVDAFVELIKRHK